MFTVLLPADASAGVVLSLTTGHNSLACVYQEPWLRPPTMKSHLRLRPGCVFKKLYGCPLVSSQVQNDFIDRMSLISKYYLGSC